MPLHAQNWTQIGANINGQATNEYLGRSVSLSSDGTTLAVGVYAADAGGSDRGQVRVYKNISGTWTQQGTSINGVTNNEYTGTSVSLSADGSIVAFGANRAPAGGTDRGQVRVYKNISGTWTQQGNSLNGLSYGEETGCSVSLSSDGGILALGALFANGGGTGRGQAQVYSAPTASCTNPTAYNVTGTGSYCSGGTGVAVGLANSETGVTYQLMNGASTVGTAVNGTGSAIPFGNQTTAATYTVVATRTTGGCTANMTGSAVVTVHTPVTKTWVGTTSNWNTASNWNPSGVPHECDNVIISSSPQVPVISTTVSRIGTTTINQDRSITINAGGTLNNTGAITVNGDIDISGTSGTGTLNNNSPGTITVNGVDADRVNGYLLVIMNSPGIGTLNNNSGATITLNNYAYLEISPDNTVTNAGTINNNSNCLLWVKGELSGAGSINNSSGAITGNGGVVSGSLYTNPVGSTIHFPYDQMGEYNCLSFNNGLTNAGNILFQIGGTTPCTAYNKITVTGTATLGGTFSAQLINGYNPPLNTTFDVITATAISGTFTNNSINLGGGKYANMYYTATKATIKIENSAPVPCTNPAAYAVTGGGSFCSGGTGVAVGLANSETGVTYQLMNGASTAGMPVSGSTGSTITFGNQTTAGTYTVVATRTTGGCTATMTGSVTVTANTTPTVYTVTGTGAVCPGGTGLAPGLNSSQTGVTYQLKNGSTNIGSTVSGTGSSISFGTQVPGTYTVVATATTGGCTANMTGSAVISTSTGAIPTTYTVTGGGTACAGSAGVAVGLSNSETGVSYQLYNGGSTVGMAVSGTGAAISFPNQTTPATYTVVATTTMGGCVATMSGSAMVTINPVPTPTISGSTTGCGTVSMTAGGGTSYAWSGGASPATAANTFSTGGTYTVTVTGANGCTATTSTTVTINTPPIPTIMGTTTACGTVSLTAGGGTTYAWSGGASPATAANTFSTGGTYTVTVTGANGCTATTSTVVTVNLVPIPTITGSTTGCGTVSLTAGGGTSYQWSGGSATTSAANTFSTGGTYTVTVTGANGCTATTSTMVIINTAPTPTITGPTAGCFLVSLMAGGGTSYMWSGGNFPNSGNNVIQTSGTYTVTVTNAGGCTATTSAVVTVSSTPNVGIAGALINCGTVSLTASGGTSYMWSGGNMVNAAVNTFNTSGTYTVTVTAAGGCTASSATTITVLPVFTTSIAGNTTACNEVILSGSGGTSYSWSGGNSPTQISNTFTTSGTYTITVTNSNNCTATSSATVTIITPTTPSISIVAVPGNTITTGTNVVFTATPTNGGTSPSYQWKVNGSNVGMNQNTYSSTTLANGDVVTCVLTPSANVCPNAPTATSNAIAMTVTTTSSCNCDPTCSPLATAAGTYTASATNVIGAYTHYCDNTGKLLLSIKTPSGITVPAAAVSIKVGNTPATFYTQFCGGTTAATSCFMASTTGNALINRQWHINQSAVTGTVSLSNQLQVVSYFPTSDYTALNTALTTNGGTALSALTGLRLYQPKVAFTGSAFPLPETINPATGATFWANGASPSTTVWQHATPQTGINAVEFKVSNIKHTGGIGKF